MPKKNKLRKNSKVEISNEQSVNSLFMKLQKIIEYKHLGFIFAISYSIILGVISLSLHKIGDYGVETDFYWNYVPAAQQFLKGIVQIEQFHGPLYPMVLSVFGLVFGDFFTGGIILGLVSAAFVIYFSFETLKNIFSPLVAAPVTLLIILNPIFIQYTYSAGTDMFFIALVSAAVFFFFRTNQFNTTNILLASFFGGLSYLTRYNGLFLFSFVIVILFINYWKIDFKKRLIVSTLFISVFILTISPWGIYCLKEKGSFFYNENYKNIAYELYGKGKIGWDEFWFKESKSFTSISQVILKDPGLFISNTLNNIPDHYLGDMEKLTGWHIGLFIALGFFLLLFNKPLKKINTIGFAYLLVNFFFFALLLLLFYGERFSMFLIPFYCSIAVSTILNRNNPVTEKIPAALRIILLSILVCITAVKAFNYNSAIINSGPNEILVIKDWFNKNIKPPQDEVIIAARKAHIAYYLNMKFKPLPLEDNYNDFITTLRNNNVKYLYFSEIEAQLRREFISLLDPQSEHPGLTALVFTSYPPAVLYKIE
ncbi:MAG: glycosyltransferase family 39 protein [Ignavibacteriales bacterium]|nr:glycosyltransferase family 39 protein [Ignavibacteriales bacterium]